MKTLGVAALLAGTVACGSNSDSVKEAQQANEARIDSTTASTPGASQGDKEIRLEVYRLVSK